MTPIEPSAENQHSLPTTPSTDADGTGLAGLRSWRAVYLFVVGVFILWVTLLSVLTRMFS